MSRAKAYRNAGWTGAAVLDGGILGWVRDDLPMAPGSAYPPEPEPPSKIAWSSDIEDTMRLAAELKKPVVIVYVAAWCDACRRFRKRALSDGGINGLADRFLWVMREVDRDISIIRTRRLTGTPTTDLVDPWGATRVRITGAVDPRNFHQRLEEFEEKVRAGPQEPGIPRKEIEPAETVRSTDIPQGYRSTGICFSNVGYGPLRLPSLSPFQSLRFGLVPRTPSTLAKGRTEAKWTESWANLWARDGGEHLVDFELLQSSVSVAYGVSDVLQVEVNFIQKSRFGGVMDGFIQGFHDTFGLQQGGRDDTSKGDFALEILKEDGSTAARLTNGDRGSFSESIVATVQHNLTCGTRVLPAFAYALSVRKELGGQQNIHDGESVDAAASISSSKRFGDFYAYASVGYSWFGREKFEDIELRTTQISLLAALEWQFAGGASFVAQYLVSQGVAKDLREFSEASYEVTFGGKFEIASMTVLEVGLIENAVTFDNSPDFGLHAGLLVRF